MSLTEPHNEFLELCAVSTSGQLTEEEQKKLQEHLAVCESCRETLQQYETVVRRAIPGFAAKRSLREPGGRALTGRKKRQENSFLQPPVEGSTAEGPSSKAPTMIPRITQRIAPFSSQSTWRHVWMLYASGILLFVSLSFYAYRAGIQRGTDIVKVAPASAARRLRRHSKRS